MRGEQSRGGERKERKREREKSKLSPYHSGALGPKSGEAKDATSRAEQERRRDQEQSRRGGDIESREGEGRRSRAEKERSRDPEQSSREASAALDPLAGTQLGEG